MPVSASLADAVDNTNLVWTTGGNANWFGESATWYYDTDAAESGDIGASQSNYLRTSVTGPGTLSFWWKVSSESSYDYLNIYIDGTRMTRISGEVNWQQKTYSLGAGAHTIEWRYTKNSGTSKGSDCGWVDKVEFAPAETTPPGPVSDLHNTTYLQNAITWTWSDPADADFSRVMVYRNNVFQINITKGVQTYTGTGLTAGTSYTISTRTVDTSGNVNPTWVNQTVWTAPAPALADAVDNTNLVWSTGGNANWFGESATWYYDTDAAESGDIGSSQSNYLRTTVTGPGTLSFWWKVSSESSYDYLNIYIDGTRMTRISGEVNWQQKTYSLGAGAHTIEWRYTKNSGTSKGSDCGWVDKVEFTPADTTPPGPVSDLHNTTYLQNAITWTWSDPTDADFSRVMVYRNNVFQINITKSVQTYTGTGLTAGSPYTISTKTVDISGNVNPTWVNQTVWTAPQAPDSVPPRSVTALANSTYQQDSIQWTWSDPTDADLTTVMVYLDNVFKTNVAKGVQTYTGTGLTASTRYTISTRTVDTSGNVNATWMNHTAWTAPVSVVLTLADAVDNTNLVWTTGGNANWFGERTTWYYGSDAAESGDIGASQSNYLRTSVTGPGTLSYWWKVSSESGYDYLNLYIDGVRETRISGEVNWQQKTYSLGAGTHTLEWRYTKNSGTSKGSDCGWVDKVEFTPDKGKLIVSFIDVGYGDSILIESPSGKTMLVDAGDENTEAYILSRRISAIDVAMVTHPHQDHFAGMTGVLKDFEVAQFIDNGQVSSSYGTDVLDVVKKQGIPHRIVKSGDIIALDPLISVQVLNPQSNLFGDTNQDSIALKLVYNQDSFLLMGDTGSNAENWLISNHKDINADVLKVGHHGDGTGTSATFLSYVTPETSIISVGANNSGFPSSALISRLTTIGSALYRTDKDGDIVINSNGLGYTVITED